MLPMIFSVRSVGVRTDGPRPCFACWVCSPQYQKNEFSAGLSIGRIGNSTSQRQPLAATFADVRLPLT